MRLDNAGVDNCFSLQNGCDLPIMKGVVQDKRRRQGICEDASLSLQEQAAGSDTPRLFVWQRREPILRSDIGRRNRLHEPSPSEFVRWEDGSLSCVAT